jgi:hypothetical protein
MAMVLAVAGVSLGVAPHANAKELIMYTGQTSPQFVTTRGTMLFAQKVARRGCFLCRQRADRRHHPPAGPDLDQ